MNFDQIVAEALKLPIEDQARLAEDLWKSLEGPEDSALADDEEWTALSLRRAAEMERGEVTPITHEEMMKRVRK